MARFSPSCVFPRHTALSLSAAFTRKILQKAGAAIHIPHRAFNEAIAHQERQALIEYVCKDCKLHQKEIGKKL